MTTAEALDTIRNLASRGRVVFSRHAQQRMQQRNVSYKDAFTALVGAHGCEVNGENWKVTGPDVDGDPLTCVVALEDDVVVVTVY